jgi:tRNA-dependent cyclodipeptide synthase
LNDFMELASLPSNARIFMGVSISNRTFNKDFVRSFGQWIQEGKVSNALVVIFDSCEIVNIKVFHGLSQEEAEKRSAMRAQEMLQMFRNLLPAASVEIETQSSYARHLPDVEALAQKLREAYASGGRFYSDVQEQIRQNLSVKAERIGSEFIEKNLDALSEYIILELAWFYSFFRQSKGTIVEVYPGEELFTKRKLIEGRYENETGIKALEVQPPFMDIRELAE